MLLSEVEKSLRIPITGQIPSSRDVPTSINRGKPIVLENVRAPGQHVYPHLRDSPGGPVGQRPRDQRVGQETASDATEGAARLMTLHPADLGRLRSSRVRAPEAGS